MSDFGNPEFSLQRRAIVAGAVAVASQLAFPVSAVARSKRSTSVGTEKLDIENCLK